MAKFLAEQKTFEEPAPDTILRVNRGATTAARKCP